MGVTLFTDVDFTVKNLLDMLNSKHEDLFFRPKIVGELKLVFQRRSDG